MKILEKTLLCYDDVLLVPQYSELASRSEADISTDVAGRHLVVPVISANMDTITEPEMVLAMHEEGATGILHRNADADLILDWMIELEDEGIIGIPSIGVHEDDKQVVELLYEEGYCDMPICVDIAHGDSKHTIEMIKWLYDMGWEEIIAGNVATYAGALRLAQAGARTIKVGVGPGSVCTTRIVTGHGYPQLSAVMECPEVKKAYPSVKIIADGGIRNSGDAVKALAAGADAVMVGGLLGGTDETPVVGDRRVLRGMASRDAQISRRGFVSNGTPEGEVAVFEQSRGPVSAIIHDLAGGLRSGLSYSGCRTIKELQENAIFVRVSANCLAENGPHALYKRDVNG